MIHLSKPAAAILLLGGILLLGACAKGAGPAVSPTASPPATPSASPAPTVSTTPGPSPASTVQPPPTAASGQQAESAQTIIKQTLELAREGKVLNTPYAAGTSLIDDIKKAYGNPDTENQAGLGMYAAYPKREVDFGFNKGSKVFDVRSADQRLAKLTVSQVKQTLGTPAETRRSGNDDIYIYPAGEKFQLKFVFPHPAKAGEDVRLKHISVFSPQDARNLMAEGTEKSLSATSGILVSVDSNPALKNQLRIAVKQVPPGFTPVKFEWRSDGKSLVNSFSQAKANGATDEETAGFYASGDGKNAAFKYDSAMKGRQGKLVFTFENNSKQQRFWVSEQTLP